MIRSKSTRLAIALCLFCICLDLPEAAGARCTSRFDGFGIHLGGMQHFNSANEQVIRTVMDKLYFELQLRHFRTSYEPYQSPSEGVYQLHCSPPAEGCTWSWEKLLEVASEPRYRSDDSRPSTFIASIWSPPYYMKDHSLVRLHREYEPQYLHFIRNITALIRARYGIEIERVSPVNEPENVFASWDHCNMDPMQLCRMVAEFNDPLVSACTENSYYWLTELYMSFKHPTLNIDCTRSCDVVSTHAYRLNLDPTSPNFLSAYYDLVPYNRTGSVLDGARIWQTEASSVYSNASLNQMGEGLDLAASIVNFVGITCVERYYFWLAFTIWTSGESLIWGHRAPGDPDSWRLQYPKKYFIYNHFTNASARAGAGTPDGEVVVERCTEEDFIGRDHGSPLTTCIKFDEYNAVFVNRDVFQVELNLERVDCSGGLCCTTADYDNANMSSAHALPAQSVCGCYGQDTVEQTTEEHSQRSTTEEDLSGGSQRTMASIFAMNIITLIIIMTDYLMP